MSIPNTSGNVGIEPDRAVESLADTCREIDSAVVALNAVVEGLNLSWSRCARDLAERVVTLARDGYIASDSVTEALGGQYAAGPLIEAAVRLGWLNAPERGSFDYPEVEPDGAGVVDAIRHCLREEP